MIQREVQAVIDELVDSGTERGLQVAVYRGGVLLVEAIAGTDAAGRSLQPDTPVHAMSTGKGVAATVVHVLADQGLFDYDTRVAELWPEFGAHGKDSVTVRQLLTHAVGVPYLPPGTTAESLCDWDGMCAALAAAKPEWEPGSQSGYHAQTWGFLVGELVRRVAGRRISEVLRDEVAGPLGVADELYFGVPESEHGRIARIEEAPGYDELFKFFPSPVPPSADFINRRDTLAADIPSGGVMSARAVARMYAALMTPVDGVRLVRDQRFRELSAVAYEGPDVVVGIPTTWALGYGIGRPGPDAGPRTVFGMPGAGGSAAYADTATGIAFAITTTRLHPGMAPGLQQVGDLVAKLGSE